jgi:hypothetical protein
MVIGQQEGWEGEARNTRQTCTRSELVGLGRRDKLSRIVVLRGLKALIGIRGALDFWWFWSWLFCLNVFCFRFARAILRLRTIVLRDSVCFRRGIF